MSFKDQFYGIVKRKKRVEATLPPPPPPPRTKWMLTICPKCKRVKWFGASLPRVVMSEESVDQLVRVRKSAQPSQHSLNRSATQRVVVNAPLRLVLGNPEDNPWRCRCGCKDGRMAVTATERLGITMFARWQDINQGVVTT
ncbi:MAG TPA: hypothetical protein VFI02_05835 [Armatimonadota bacterium]|nr:hypothetical protein [Armatimonadota bacterium]